MLEIKSVIETSLYVDDLAATEKFYSSVLGLKVIAKEADRHVFFQVGARTADDIHFSLADHFCKTQSQFSRAHGSGQRYHHFTTFH